MTDLTLSLERQIAAQPATVWRCLTEPALIEQWFAPRPVVTRDVVLELRPGGAFSTTMDIPDHGEMKGDPGCVLVVEPAARLVWTSAFGPGFAPNAIGAGAFDFAMTADLTLAPRDGGTLYRAQVSHATAEAKSAHEKMGFHDGWAAAAAQLAELAASLDA